MNGGLLQLMKNVHPADSCKQSVLGSVLYTAINVITPGFNEKMKFLKNVHSADLLNGINRKHTGLYVADVVMFGKINPVLRKNALNVSLLYGMCPGLRFNADAVVINGR
jgi:hypothetical protein